MSRSLAVQPPQSALAARWGLSDEKLAVVRSVIAPDAPDDVLDLYFERCKIAGCDPFSKMIYVINRPSKPRQNEKANRPDGKIDRWGFQSSIDLFRSIADSSGEYTGQVGPYWCGEDGVWVEVWLARKHPSAAKVGVLKRGFDAPLWAVARWDSYVQSNYEGNPTGLWATHGDVMIAKCAEALAMRKAFPQKLQGLYTSDEMAQADTQERAALAPASTASTVRIPQAAIAGTPTAEKRRPKSVAELEALFVAAEIPGKFGEWIVEHIAPDIKQRAKKVLTPDEALAAEERIAAYVPVEDAAFTDEPPSQQGDELPPDDEQQPELLPPAATKPAAAEVAPHLLQRVIDTEAMELGIPPSVATDLQRAALGGQRLTKDGVAIVLTALRDYAEGQK